MCMVNVSYVKCAKNSRKSSRILNWVHEYLTKNYRSEQVPRKTKNKQKYFFQKDSLFPFISASFPITYSILLFLFFVASLSITFSACIYLLPVSLSLSVPFSISLSLPFISVSQKVMWNLRIRISFSLSSPLYLSLSLFFSPHLSSPSSLALFLLCYSFIISWFSILSALLSQLILTEVNPFISRLTATRNPKHPIYNYCM